MTRETKVLLVAVAAVATGGAVGAAVRLAIPAATIAKAMLVGAGAAVASRAATNYVANYGQRSIGAH